jgi:mono/diheme cytochrome c family protein
MNSSLLATIHLIVVNLFVLIYLIKIILLFSNQNALEKFTKVIRVPEMIISVLFLVTGIWLFVILGAIKTLQIIKLVLIFVSIPVAVIGFKKMNKALALISFLLIIGAYGLAEAARNKPFIQAEVITTGDEFPGYKIFAANCSMCHGSDGKKMYRDATDLSTSALNPSLIPAMIKEGSRGKMPAFGNTLTDAEINSVAVYVQTLRGK